MQRLLQPELMDDPAIDPAMHHAALTGLRRINVMSGTAGYLWRAMVQIARRRGLDKLRVLDVACGGGELAIDLARRSGRSGLAVEVDGCDLSPTAAERATRVAARRGIKTSRFFTHDALGQPLPGGYDIIYTTLFLHHLTEEQAITLLGRMREAAGSAVLVDDLVRSRLGYALAWFGCRLLTRSPVVHYDGPVSVQAGFTPNEALRLAEQAGLRGAVARGHWPERYLLSWENA